MNKPGLDGDYPCADCGTEENIVWFTDNVFWNDVMGDEGGILCTNCFVVRAEKKYKVTGWRLIPEFKWEKQDELSMEDEMRNIKKKFDMASTEDLELRRKPKPQ